MAAVRARVEAAAELKSVRDGNPLGQISTTDDFVVLAEASLPGRDSLCSFAASDAGDTCFESRIEEADDLEVSEVTATSDFLGLCSFAFVTDDDWEAREETIFLVPAFEDTGGAGFSGIELLASKGMPMPVSKKQTL